MSTTLEQETPQQRGIKRLLSTVVLMRKGAADADEASVYVNEEKRLVKLLARLNPQTEGAGGVARAA
jgi:hypothetical protein